MSARVESVLPLLRPAAREEEISWEVNSTEPSPAGQPLHPLVFWSEFPVTVTSTALVQMTAWVLTVAAAARMLVSTVGLDPAARLRALDDGPLTTIGADS